MVLLRASEVSDARFLRVPQMLKSVTVVLIAVASDDAICDNLLGCKAPGWQGHCKSLGTQRFYS